MLNQYTFVKTPDGVYRCNDLCTICSKRVLTPKGSFTFDSCEFSDSLNALTEWYIIIYKNKNLPPLVVGELSDNLKNNDSVKNIYLCIIIKNRNKVPSLVSVGIINEFNQPELLYEYEARKNSRTI